jgi:hypothetical protein
MNAVKLLSITSAIFFGMLTAGAAHAQQGGIGRHFVVKSTGLFEVTMASTGGRFLIIPKNEFFVVEGRSLQVRGQTDRVATGEKVFAVATVAERSRCETIFHFANGYRYARTTELHPARNSVPPEIVPPNAVRIETRISNNSSPTSRSITSPVATR